jgi:biopolymer transport protein ExbB/TolQ
MNIKLEMYLIVLSLIVLAIVLFWLVRTEKRLKKFFLGKKASNLENIIVSMQEELKDLQKEKDLMVKEIGTINQKLRKSIRGLEMIRFNPFSDQGSNQSFAIGMLDEEDNGIVISSLYSRDRMSVFAKPIKEGKSKYELSKEEKEVLEKAKI